MNRLRRQLFLQSLEDRTVPATFTVINLNDSGADSLRDCLSKANAAAGADTIDFKSGLSGAITLTTGEIAIQDAVSILGPGAATLSISGKNTSRIFNTSAAPAGTSINISGLTLSNGKADKGGAMLLGDESLTLNQCVMTGNSATIHGGAMNASGASTVTANGCSFTNNTATYSAGVLLAINSAVKTVWNSCTISGNTCQVGGGGIYVGGDLLVEQCTISNNQTTSFVGRGAGILASGTFSSLVIRNSTISGNTSSKNGGGIELVYFSGVLSVQNSTITNNTASSSGGGIHLYSGTGTVSLESTIVSGNSSPSEADINCFNKVSMKASAVGSNKGFVMTDLGGNLPFGAKLIMGPLANNGGPTQTHAILAGSPLLDKGSNPAGLPTDQRGAGFPRLNGSGIDIGALEAKATTFTVTNQSDSGVGSLRQAVLNSNANAGNDTIDFDPTFFNVPRTISLTTGEMAVSDAVTISGPGSDLATIHGNNASRIFNTTSAPTGAVIDISGVTLTKGNASTGGAILANGETLKITQCVLTNNNAVGGGGAVFGNAGTSIIATQTSFVGNTNFASLTQGGNGGALNNSASGCKTVLVACTISGNGTGGTNGAGIYVSGYLAIEGSTIASNATNFLPAAGGGIAVVGTFTAGTLRIRNSTISGNFASEGGGINWLTPNGEMIIQNCTIANNTSGFAGGTGGGIFIASGGVLALESTIVSGNVNGTAPDISSVNSVKIKNSAVGSKSGFTMTDLGGNLPFGPDLKLGPLANNGGFTQTHSLMAGSPAVDKGSNPASLTNDQRGSGFPRSFGAGVDIGAYETCPQTFLVTNTNDTSTGSLRSAIDNANNNAGPDTIIFDSAFFNVPRTITLTSGELNIQDGVTINAPPALVTIDAKALSRIFNIDPAVANDVVAINGLALINGKVTGADGGAIRNFDANLFLTNVTVTNCSTTDDGGGISVALPEGSLVLNNCNISGNSAQSSGGGIYFFVSGSLAIFNSTISGNKAVAGTGGGIYFFGDVGSGGFTITNSTISNNSAGGAGGGLLFTSFSGAAAIRNSTITGNSSATSGGGIARGSGSGTVSLSSSIVAGNTSPINGPDLFFAAAFPMSANNNLIGVADSGNFTLTGMGNLTGTTATPLNAKLGPLANNGGPTLTHALLAGSPAINKGSNPGNLTTDQRGAGFPRVTGTTIDIGAFETQPTTFVVTNSNDSGAGSLRQAITNANNSGGLDTITFDATFFNVPRIIPLTSGGLHNTDALTIIGPGAELCTVSGANLTRILDTQQAHGNLPVSISGLTFAFGQLFGTDDGAAIFAADQELTLSSCVFTSNVATRRGGAIRIGTGSLIATDCIFTGNSATNNGGALYCAASDVTLRRCTISGNTAGNNGGGVYAYNVGNLLIEDCTFSSNQAISASGGAVLNVRQGGTSQMVVRNSTISGNSAGSEGGGMAVSSDVNLVVQNSTLTANKANSVGGGIFGPTVVIASSILFGNQANVSGPEIVANTATITTSLVGSKAGVLTFTGDSFTTSNIGINPLLGPLADNGGPTLTHALLVGSPALNKGSNPASLNNDQRGVGFARVVGSAADIGAFELQSAPMPVTIASVQVNDGSAQRSRVISLQVTFDAQVTFNGAVAAAFSLSRNGGGAVGGFMATANVIGGATVVTLSGFTGAETQSGSLADGLYTLTVFASQILNFDGNGDGTPGDNFVLIGNVTTNKLFRLFGDADGNGTVNVADFAQFRNFFGLTGPSMFDFNNDNLTNTTDFAQFRGRFGITLTP